MPQGAQTRPSVWELLPILLTAAYPLGTYLGLRSGQTAVTAWVVLSIVLIQLPLLMIQRASKFASVAALAAATAALSAATFEQATLLLLLPALTNFALAGVFGSSLGETPLIEQFARLQDPGLSDEKTRYCRRATQVWTAFFISNAGLIMLLAAVAPLTWWTLYTGLIAHGFALGLGAFELTLRIRKFGVAAAGPGVLAIMARVRGQAPAPSKGSGLVE